MKKYLLILILFFTCLNANAKTLEGEITFNWVALDQDRRNLYVEIAKGVIDDELTFTKKEFKSKFADSLKDVDTNDHYTQAQNKLNETSKYKIVGFFLGRILYMYGIQYKNDMSHIYYYDVLGHLEYVDIFSNSYPNYPFYSKQFDKNGKLVASYYFVSDEVQYAFDKNMKFLGVWVGSNFYNIKGKCILTRTK